MLGERVGQYQVTGKLGEGGMGAVYLAQHTLIGRPAAIKVLKAEFTHRPEVVERFFNEARAASAIRHPGIVEIYDFGYHVDDSAYIVMEHLEGESLEARLRRLRRIPVDRALNLVRQVASGLAAAHDQEIIHRDLKPDNIFVVADPDIPGGERTKILDFGIAKLASQGRPGSYKTSTGTVMGTPAYMAPEQCKGAGRVDRRADLYALGCILFEMLCGRPPFEAEGGGEVMAQHIYAAPPSPLAFDPTIPAAVDALIQRLLAKEADQRHQSAREVIAAIDAIAERPSRVGGGVAPAPIGSNAGPAASSGTPAEPKTTLGGAARSIQRARASRSRATFVAPLLAAVVLAAAAIIFAVTRGGDDADRGDRGDGAPIAAGDPSIGADSGGETEARRAAPADSEASAGLDAGETATREPTAAGSSASVVISIDSTPRGADVYKQPLGLRVGPTPYRIEQPAAEGELVYVLKKAGYHTKEIALAADQNAEINVVLERRTKAAKPPASAKGAGARAGTTGSSSGAVSASTAGSTSDRAKAAKTTPDAAPRGADKARDLNPFDKKKTEKGKGRSLNPFDK